MPDDPREPLLPVTSDRVRDALVTIMRDVGLSESQIRGRFPDLPADEWPPVASDPGGVPGGSGEPPGEPRE